MLFRSQASEELLNWQKAAESYEKLLKDYPKSEDAKQAQLWFGNALHQLGRYSESVNAFNKILDNPKKYNDDIKVRAQLSKSESLYEMGQFKAAADSYLMVSLTYFEPDLGIYAMFKAGDSFEKMGRWADAEIWYNKVLEKYGTPGGEYYDQKTKEWDNTIELARKRLERIKAIHVPEDETGGE